MVQRVRLVQRIVPDDAVSFVTQYGLQEADRQRLAQIQDAEAIFRFGGADH